MLTGILKRCPSGSEGGPFSLLMGEKNGGAESTEAIFQSNKMDVELDRDLFGSPDTLCAQGTDVLFPMS